MTELIEMNSNITDDVNIKLVSQVDSLTSRMTDVVEEDGSVEWRLTERIKEVKVDLQNNIKTTRDELTDNIKTVKDELTDYIKTVKSDLETDINNVRTDINNVRSDINNVRTDLKSDIKEKHANLKWFMGIFMSVGVTVMGVIVALITLLVK